MNQRCSPEEAVQGVETTADKIRALASAGYDRTEISASFSASVINTPATSCFAPELQEACAVKPKPIASLSKWMPRGRRARTPTRARHYGAPGCQTGI
jgi:hypothetical protein